MVEPITPKETFDERGRVNVSDDLFTPETPAETTSPAETTPPETTPQVETTPPAETTSSTTETPSDTTTPPTTTTPKLLAGKYKTVDELKAAYQNLGGDPTRFQSDTALEEAYEYRNSEYTRVNQETAERERLSLAIEEKRKSEQTPEQMVEGMMGKIDWEQVKDAQTLTKQLLPILIAGMPKGQAPMDETTLVEKLIPIIQDRERKQEALAAVETEVPRLKNDQSFRKAFALHVMGGKDGIAYPKTADGLRAAMKDFLAFSRSMADETARQKEIDMRGKNAALTPAGGSPGSVIPNNTPGDEADQIIGAYAEKQRKFGFTGFAK